MGLTNPGQKNSAQDHARRVREMFGRISPRYDLLNHLLSANIDTRWRRRVVRKLQPSLRSDARVLDVGCGTGDLSIELFEKTAAQVTGIDFCRPMLELAQAKAPHLRFVEGDALRLPFSDAAFDCVTVAFALRNLASVEQGLAELNRVLKPGGMVAVLEFSQPTVPGIRQLVRFYYWRLLPWIGGLFSGLRKGFQDFADSIFPLSHQQTPSSIMRGARISGNGIYKFNRRLLAPPSS